MVTNNFVATKFSRPGLTASSADSAAFRLSTPARNVSLHVSQLRPKNKKAHEGVNVFTGGRPSKILEHHFEGLETFILEWHEILQGREVLQNA